MITITLNQIKQHDPCADGWSKVLKANGGIKADFDKPFPVSSILDSNDLADALWALRGLPEYDALWRKFASWCALENIEKITSYCSSEDYALMVKWLETNDLELRESARSAARSAALSAAWAAAWAAESAWAAAESARSARSRQSDKLRAILDAGGWV